MVFCFVFFAGLGLNVWLAIALDMNHAPWYGQVVYGLCILGMFIAAVVWLSRIMGTPESLAQHGLLCPVCEAPLTGSTGDLAMTTGRCAGCGSRIVVDTDLQELESGRTEGDREN